MPRSRSQFETSPREYATPQVGRISMQALEFLCANPEQAFQSHEISAEIGVPAKRINPALSQLRQCHVVEFRDDHWAVTQKARSVLASISPNVETA